MAGGTKQRIAVLGGGLGSLATVFNLTDEPGWESRYEITVYQQGWRLGGKCASGHDMRDGHGHRIYEHGLHVFAGFYHYAFNLLDRAYTALGRPDGHPNQTVWDAFTGQDTVTLMDHAIGDPTTPVPWNIDFQPNMEVPGQGLPKTSIEELVHNAMATLLGIPPGIGAGTRPTPNPAPPPLIEDDDDLLHAALHAALMIAKDMLHGVEGAIGGVVHMAASEIWKLSGDVALDEIIRLLEVKARSISAASGTGTEALPIERLMLSIYLFQTLVHGIAADNVLRDGFDPLDRYELSEWLHKNAEAVARAFKIIPDPAGAATTLVNWAPIVSGYDYVFGFLDGDPSKPAFAAGTALRAFLRLAFGYKGHLFWLMRGAMGDVVIAPIYLALMARGVKFKFFNRILAVDADATRKITSIEVAEQVALASGVPDYSPMIQVPLPGWPAGMPLDGWPAEPLWEQLADGAALKAAGRDFEHDFGPPLPTDTVRTLTLGVDFDTVVLGISLGALPVICAKLPAIEPRWQAMFDSMKVTATLALQLWMTRTNEDLGNPTPGRTLTGAEQPFSTWADMSHLLSRETWAVDRPQAILYFCGQMAGGAMAKPGVPLPPTSVGDAVVHTAAFTWLRDNAGQAWPRALSETSPFGIDPELLFTPVAASGPARFEQQYWRANLNPSDLYVQSVPNSLFTRMRSHESGFSNLFLCGDWTRNGLNAGAAEAAAMSGVQCANAIAGNSAPIAGETDHATSD